VQTIKLINYIVSAVFFVCYFYQFAYVLVPFLLKEKRENQTNEFKRYAVLISARNESAVIGNLIKSIKRQDYPSELVDVFVVADNCDDDTAEVSRNAGAIVWERQNKELVGKGYALDYLYHKIKEEYSDKNYDGFFVFDADNILDGKYISEMNKTFTQGYKVVTSYRNSKNYDSNWISAGYALWFLRESKYINNSRMLLGTSCAISGTGFLVSREMLEKTNGWKYFLLTEDIQFTVDTITSGECIGYSKNAVLYDEQPVKFSQSWRQRMRWSKGFYQVFNHYGNKLFMGFVKDKSFACFDLFMTIAPAIILTSLTIIMNVIGAVVYHAKGFDASDLINMMVNSLVNMYLIVYALGFITTMTEWKQIHTTPFKKILYTFTFPIFLGTYVLISVMALFKKVKWEPIHHSQSISIEEMQTANAE